MSDVKNNEAESVRVDFSPRLLVLFKLIHAAREAIGVDQASMPADDKRAKFLLLAYAKLTESLILISSANCGKVTTAEQISNLLGVMQGELQNERLVLDSKQADEQARLQRESLAAHDGLVN